MLKLKTDSVNWAIDHLVYKGDTDLFPKPFEINAFSAERDFVINSLSRVDIGSYKWGTSRRAIVPKTRLFFRKATQLDPFDSLVLGAIIHEFGQNIEEKRIPKEANSVFSYRFQPSLEGELYNKESNWNLFWEISVEKAKTIPNGFVAITDVVDYYNQINHHVVGHELEQCRIPGEIVNSIIRLISGITEGVSRGIPVGPHVVHLLAEIAFNPIDRSLISRDYEFTRYVDDICIFCRTEVEAESALFDFAEILDKHQRLTPQARKTAIMPALKFINMAIEKAADDTTNDAEKAVLDVINKYSLDDRYRRFSISKLTDSELKLFEADKIEAVFNFYLKRKEPDFPRFRWFLRRLSQVGVPAGVSFLIKNIESLTPAIGELCLYIASVEKFTSADWNEIGHRLLSSLDLPLIERNDFLKLVLVDLFSVVPELDCLNNLLALFNNASPFVRRKIIKAATSGGQYHWLRELKEEIKVVDPWQRRAIILGASSFSKEEKKYWLNRVIRDNYGFTDNIVAYWVRNLDEPGTGTY